MFREHINQKEEGERNKTSEKLKPKEAFTNCGLQKENYFFSLFLDLLSFLLSFRKRGWGCKLGELLEDFLFQTIKTFSQKLESHRKLFLSFFTLFQTIKAFREKHIVRPFRF